MAKAKKVAEEEMEEGDAGATTPESRVVEDGDVIFVNREKLERARDIIALVTGKRVPRNDNEAERKEHYIAQFAAAEVDPKSKGALRAAYEILGGLIRTPAEQEEAEQKAQAARRKSGKKKVEE